MIVFVIDPTREYLGFQDVVTVPSFIGTSDLEVFTLDDTTSIHIPIHTDANYGFILPPIGMGFNGKAVVFDNGITPSDKTIEWFKTHTVWSFGTFVPPNVEDYGHA